MSDVREQKMFGEFELSADDRGRFIVPIEFRHALGKKFTITRGPDRVALLIPETVWNPIQEELYGKDFNIASHLLHRLFANRSEISTDNRHRTTIPKSLQDWMKLGDGKEIVLLGMGSVVEIWAGPIWKEYQTNFNFANIFEAAEAVGLAPIILR